MSEEADKEHLAKLESDFKTVELQATLSEWVAESIHKIGAFVMILKWWRNQMHDAGYVDTTIDGVLPMIIHRIWPDPSDEIEHDLGIDGDE